MFAVAILARTRNVARELTIEALGEDAIANCLLKQGGSKSPRVETMTHLTRVHPCATKRGMADHARIRSAEPLAVAGSFRYAFAKIRVILREAIWPNSNLVTIERQCQQAESRQGFIVYWANVS